jgi:hypothetical protein
VEPKGRGSRAALISIATINEGLHVPVTPLIPEITENNLLGVLRKIPKTKENFV